MPTEGLNPIIDTDIFLGVELNSDGFLCVY